MLGAPALMIVAATAHSSIDPQAGRVLIASTASMLLCLFLSPRFIEFLRQRSFGQHIREELVQHLEKAGTPTMGGIMILVAFAVPYLCLSTRDPESLGVFGAVLACGCWGSATTTRSSGIGAHWDFGRGPSWPG